MQYEYDSWNRIQKMTYPDGEEVYYEYNLGGMLEKVYGQVKVSEPLIPVPHRDGEQGTDGVMRGGEVPWIIPEPGPFHPGWPTVTYTYPYIDSIAYNEFELKSEVFYGNGTHTQYGYDSIQRLHVLQSQTRAGIDMQDITYTYDAVSNITCIFNAANYPGMNLGGTYSHSYEYDDLYRLTYSTGTWEDRPYHLGLVDTVRMAYHKNGRIARKNEHSPHPHLDRGQPPANGDGQRMVFLLPVRRRRRPHLQAALPQDVQQPQRKTFRE